MSRISAKKRLSVKGVSPFIFANVVGIANYNLTLKRILKPIQKKGRHKYSLGSGINIHYNSKVSWPSRLFRHYEYH